MVPAADRRQPDRGTSNRILFAGWTGLASSAYAGDDINSITKGNTVTAKFAAGRDAQLDRNLCACHQQHGRYQRGSPVELLLDAHSEAVSDVQ